MAGGLTAGDLRLLGGGFAVGIAVGVGVGYFATKKHLEVKYDRLAMQEIDEAREYYQAAKKATEARLKEPLHEVVEYLGYVKKEDAEKPEIENERAAEEGPVDYTKFTPEPAPSDGVENVFETHPTVEYDWDYEEETRRRRRNPGRPYVIHLEEFGEDGFETVCYTYYEVDETLADERDEVVDDVDNVVGLANLERFGQGSDNPNIVMVRNESITTDFEISKANSSYAADVAGIQHSAPLERIARRHREFDDD